MQRFYICVMKDTKLVTHTVSKNKHRLHHLYYNNIFIIIIIQRYRELHENGCHRPTVAVVCEFQGYEGMLALRCIELNCRSKLNMV